MTGKRKVRAYYRLAKRLRFQFIRSIASFFLWRWIKSVSGFEKVVQQDSAILIANHLSYYDFFVLGALFKRPLVFVAVKKVRQAFLIRWLAKFHMVVYIDRDNPGTTFFRAIIRHLELGRLVVVYPEGTRSRSGKMLKPKPGFVKLAMKANVPVIPVGMRGTYEILPPHSRVPKLKRCEVIFGQKRYISPSDPELEDIFFESKENPKFSKLTKKQTEKIAIRIMEGVRRLSGQEWDHNDADEVKKALKKEGNQAKALTS